MVESQASVESTTSKAGTSGAGAAEGAPAVPDGPPVKEMRAIVCSSFGGLLKSVRVMKRPEPSPGDGEVLIRVRACGLNFIDLMLRLGCMDSTPKPPFILGFECAGIVESVGGGVVNFTVGDRVAALSLAESGRTWAELVAVPADTVYKLPEKMTFQDAVSITLNGVTAHALIHDVANISAGQTVLVHSLGGGVGQCIAQLIKGIPNVTLIGTASKAKHDALTGSATYILDINDYVPEVKKIAPEGVDVVLDCLCGEDSNKGYQLVKPMGKYVLYGTSFMVTGETRSIFSFAKSWWQVDKVSPMRLFDENKTLAGFHLRHLLTSQGKQEYVRSLVNKVYKLYEQNRLRPVVDSIWALEDIAEAMQKLHDRRNVGKLILDPEAEPRVKAVPDSPAPDSANNDKQRKDSKAGSGEESKPADSQKQEEKK